MKQPYPDIKPYWRGRLDLNGQQLYVEQAGNPQGIPLLFLHDGPGLGCHPSDRCLFDPQRYRIILLDQRGCGQSQPHLQMTGNNLTALSQDLDGLAEQLEIEQWVVAGVGWGALLALHFAIERRDRVMALLLVGGGLGTDQELRWLFECGAPQVYPEAYGNFCRGFRLAPGLPVSELLKHCNQFLSGTNELEKMHAARLWVGWMSHCCSLRPQPDLEDQLRESHVLLAFASLQCHYMANRWFLDKANGLVDRLVAIDGIPLICVHGRFDMVVPLASTFVLQGKLPDAKLQIVREAGHSVREAALIDAVVKAQLQLADELGAAPPECG